METIDNSKLELVGSTWRVFVETQDFSLVPEISHDYRDVYEALHFNDASTVSIYNVFENGERVSNISNEFEFSYSKNNLIIIKFGMEYSGVRSGDVLRIFDKDYEN